MHGLWGDSPRLKQKVYADVRAALRRPLRPEPVEVFCFGEENRRFLLAQGIRPIFYLGNKQPPGNLWLAKLLIIQEALRRHRQVVWLDWDCRLLCSLPREFWRTISSGAVLRSSLRQYKCIQCPWRRTHRRKLPGGAMIYCRSLQVATELVELALANPQWSDEQVIARWWDLKHGEFDLTAWRAGGWELDCYLVRGQIWPPRQALFTPR